MAALRLLALLVAALALAGCGGDDEAAQPPAATEPPVGADEPRGEPVEVTYSTSFGQFGRDAYAYVALEKGYFTDAGFDVEIVPGAGSVDVAKLIAAGRVDYGPLDFSALAVTRANEEIPVKIVSFVHQRSLSAILTRPQAGISSPADLEGKSIADSPGSTVRVMFPLYAEEAGVDADAVTFRSAEPPSLPALLASGQVDAVGQFVVGVPLFERATEGEIVVLPYADHLDLPGLGVAASDSKIENDPDEVRRFVAALNRGLQDALDDPEEAARILSEHVAEADVEIARRELELMRDYVLDEYTDEHGIGSMDEERLASALEIVAASFELGSEPAVDDVWAPGFTGG